MHLVVSVFFLLTFVSHATSDPAFACTFENDDWCGMQNGAWYDPVPPLYNFSIFTGLTVPDKELAPSVDHTTNSSSGGFVYWHRPANGGHTARDGRLSTPIFELREHLCLSFAYFIRSSASVNNGTYLVVDLKGCYATNLWVLNRDDTQGWQTDTIQLLDLTCNITIGFALSSSVADAVSVALDDVVVDTCPRYITTTASTPSSNSSKFTFNAFLLPLLFFCAQIRL